MSEGELAAAPSESVGFVLQMAAVGGLPGTAFAVWRRRYDPEADTWQPTAIGGVGAGLIGLVVLLVEALP